MVKIQERLSVNMKVGAMLWANIRDTVKAKENNVCNINFPS